MRQRRTYQEIAKLMEVTLCSLCSLDNCANMSSNTVHWHERRVTRPGLRNFLKLVSQLRLVSGMPEWQALWAQNIWAYRKARYELGVLLPAHLSKRDRARVRYLMDRDSISNPAARRWAKGGY